jgi:hypothetical protein
MRMTSSVLFSILLDQLSLKGNYFSISFPF